MVVCLLNQHDCRGRYVVSSWVVQDDNASPVGGSVYHNNYNNRNSNNISLLLVVAVFVLCHFPYCLLSSPHSGTHKWRLHLAIRYLPEAKGTQWRFISQTLTYISLKTSRPDGVLYILMMVIKQLNLILEVKAWFSNLNSYFWVILRYNFIELYWSRSNSIRHDGKIILTHKHGFISDRGNDHVCSFTQSLR